MFESYRWSNPEIEGLRPGTLVSTLTEYAGTPSIRPILEVVSRPFFTAKSLDRTDGSPFRSACNWNASAKLPTRARGSRFLMTSDRESKSTGWLTTCGFVTRTRIPPKEERIAIK